MRLSYDMNHSKTSRKTMGNLLSRTKTAFRLPQLNGCLIKRMKQWVVSGALCLSLIALAIPLCLFPVYAAPTTAAVGDLFLTGANLTEGVDYRYAGNRLTVLSNKEITVSGTTSADCILIPSGGNANLILNGLNVTEAVTHGIALEENANLNLILADNSTNSLMVKHEVAQLWFAGIYVPEKAVLTISGTGKLNVKGGYGCPAIGGIGAAKTGKITIAGGDITAVGGWFAAAIGGGHQCPSGEILISGGKVNAKGHCSAGIGNGDHCGTDEGTITITGGEVYAIGGTESAGIGSGRKANWDNLCKIIIQGGIVVAEGGEKSAGIGGGNQRPCGSVTIRGGTITATGNGGAADIGDGVDSYVKGSIKITGGSINARANQGVPTDGNGNPVYLTAVAASDITGAMVTNTEFKLIDVSDLSYTYGMKDVKSDQSGKIYVWLPAGGSVTKLRDADDRVYLGSVTVLEDNTASGILPAVCPAKITTSALSNGTSIIEYKVQLEAEGNPLPNKWLIAEGALPAGLTLSMDGIISGIPQEAGTFTFTVSADNGIGDPDTKELSLVIDPSYIVTIPAEAQLGAQEYVIKAENVKLPQGKQLDISLEGTSGEDNAFILTTKGGATIAYYITSEEKKVAVGDSLLVVKPEISSSGEVSVVFHKPTEYQFAGHYYGTVTFSVSIINE